MTPLTPDIAVVGASLGGVLAAWRAAQAGCQVLLVAQEPWLGGQLTSQAVPPDEHPLIEHGGASQSYLRFREDMRRQVRALPGFLDRATLTDGTNPGDGWVSRLCIEPVWAARWLEELLAPQQAAGRLRVLRLSQLLAAQCKGADVRELLLRRHDGSVVTVRAPWYVDGTDTGELLLQARLPYRLGKEAQSEFDEPDAPPQADALDQQPVTHVLALRRQDQPGPIIAAPAGYARWREHRLPHYGHLQFSEQMPGRGRGVVSRLPWVASGQVLDWWRYRRIVSRAQWAGPRQAARADVTLLNWAQNDYALHPLLDGPLPEPAVREAARALSSSLLHWLQTEAPRHDGGVGYPEWQPAADVLGTADGLAQTLYVRESRRIVGRSTLTQRDMQAPPQQRSDAVAIAWYNLDMHPTCVSGQGCNAPVQPFELPLGVFIPAQGGNVIAGCKNIATTQLAGACTRVHPAEWAVGEVAGLLAAQALREGWPDSPAQLQRLQQSLDRAGVARHWSDDLLALAAGAAH